MSSGGVALGGRERRRGKLPYWLTFGLAVAVLAILTGFFVLIVLPERFVLRAGLRESGISFPAEGAAFTPPQAGPLVEPPRPVVAATAPADSAPVPDSPEYRASRLARARILRDDGRLGGALGVYRELLADRPADASVRLEMARALAWSERYDEAASELRNILRRHPHHSAARLELARVLYWNEQPERAREVLAAIPPAAPEAHDAAALDRRIATELASAGGAASGEQTAAAGDSTGAVGGARASAGDTPVAADTPTSADRATALLGRAREAAAHDDLVTAAGLYREAVEADPTDREAWVERIDFLQYRMQNREAAIDALMRYGERFELTAGERFRLARLHAWSGDEEAARATLAKLLADHPDHAGGWALLGDLHRWRGDRPAAADAYARALALEPAHAGALAGHAELEEETRNAVAAREPAGAGPTTLLFTDSDDFMRLDVAGEAAFRWSTSAVRATAGWRRLEGLTLSGAAAAAEGPFATVELTRWWRQATIGTSLWIGGEDVGPAGFEPSFGAGVELPDLAGFALGAEYRHGPAYPLTVTLESAIEPVHADRVAVSLYRALGAGWSLSGSAEAARLASDLAGGTDGDGGSDNTRARGGVTLGRDLGSGFNAGLGTSLLGYSDPAPAAGVRGLYWDPESAWSSALHLGWRAQPELGWGAHARLSPGLALIDEREVSAEWVPQVGTGAGISYLGEHTDFEANLFYSRGREREYSAFGLDLRLVVRP